MILLAEAFHSSKNMMIYYLKISIGPNEALEIEETQSIWSARFSSYDKIIVRYAGTMESVIDLIYKELRRKFRE